MDNLDPKQFILMMRQIAEEKNLPVDVVQDALEQALAAAYRKDYGSKDQIVRTMLNTKTGDYKLFVSKDVVKEVEDPTTQISLQEARKINSKAKIDEQIEQAVKAETFGRVAAQTAKQVILQKLREAERDVIYAEYSEQVGNLLNGIVQRIEPRVVYVDLGKAQGILPASEQIPGEHYTNGQRIKVFLRDVETSPRGPQLILSRANAEFIALLFKQEVPEMENDAVEIKTIEREAGGRTKLAVASTVPGVDPVGTFVGGHGTRVQAVMNEVGDEKIDIIQYSEDPTEFIANALSPTKIGKIELNKKDKLAVVNVPDDQLSVAIGKNGQNVRLASKLTGWQIDIRSESGPAQKTTQDQPAVKPQAKRTKIASKADLESALIKSVDKDAPETKTRKKTQTNKPKQSKPAKPKQKSFQRLTPARNKSDLRNLA